MADTPKHLRAADPELERLKITHAIEVEDKKIADDHEEKEFNPDLIDLRMDGLKEVANLLQ